VSVLLRQPGGFEGFGVIDEVLPAGDPAVSKCQQVGVRLFHFDAAAAATPSQAEGDDDRISRSVRLDDLRVMRLPGSHESLSPLPQLSVAAKGTRLGNLGAKDHLSVVIEEAQERIDVAFVPRLHEAVHDLHVLLRHRRRSIPQAPESA
jgi:hypothetical protein